MAEVTAQDQRLKLQARLLPKGWNEVKALRVRIAYQERSSPDGNSSGDRAVTAMN